VRVTDAYVWTAVEMSAADACPKTSTEKEPTMNIRVQLLRYKERGGLPRLPFRAFPHRKVMGLSHDGLLIDAAGRRRGMARGER